MPDDQQADDRPTDDRLADDRLTDPCWLVNADPADVLALLNDAVRPEALLAAAVYRTSVWWHRNESAAKRRHVLALDAARYGDPAFAARIATVQVPGEPAAAWDVRWAAGGLGESPLRRLVVEHDAGPLPVVLTDHVGLGYSTGITGGWGGAVQVWNASAKEALSEPVSGHDASVRDVAEALMAGHPVLATGDVDGVARLWDLATGRQLGEPLTGPSVVDAMAWAVRGRDIVVTGDWDARLWDVSEGWYRGSPYLSFRDVSAASIGSHLLGFPDALIGGEDGTLREWNVAPDGYRTTESGHAGKVTAVADCRHRSSGADRQRGYLVTAGEDGALRIRDRSTEELIGEPLRGHTGAVRVLMTAEVGDRAIAVSAGDDGTVRRWDVATGEAVGEPMTGHTSAVWAIALCKADANAPVGPASEDDGYPKPLSALATAVVDGRPVAVTAGTTGIRFGGDEDSTIRLWDLATGRPDCEPLVACTGMVTALATAVVGGRPIAITGGGRPDPVLRLWDLAGGERIAELVDGPGSDESRGEGDDAGAGARGGFGHPADSPFGSRPDASRRSAWVTALALAETDGRTLAVTGTSGDENGAHVSIWDLTNRRAIARRLPARTAAVTAAATAIVDGRPVAITGGSGDGTGDISSGEDSILRLWDMLTAAPIGVPLTGHTAGIVAVATGLLAGRPIAVSTDWSGTILRWDLTTRTPIGAPLRESDDAPSRVGEALVVAAIGPDATPAIVTGGDSLHILDFVTGRPIGPELPMPLKSRLRAVAVAPDGGLLAAVGEEVVHLTPR